jgi:hypothetical protein
MICMYHRIHSVFVLLLIAASFSLSLPTGLFAQASKGAKPVRKPAPAKPAAPKAAPLKAGVFAGTPLHLIGIRPGVSMDSIQRIIQDAGVTMREVKQDTLTRCFADQSIHIYVIDSIIVRLTYMRMSFLVDRTTNRLRRFTITPRESSIMLGQDDDLEPVLLLYIGQTWGKPEINLDPPLPFFRWRTGNIETRGFIKRGYPVWVMEG